MYRAFNLKLCSSALKDFKGDEYEYNSDKNKAEIQLKKLINSDYEIAAEDIKSIIFPQNSYDIFISHSHSDLDLALRLRRYLKVNLKLNAFVDSIFWANIDKIQKELDDQYRTRDNNYEYETVKKVAQYANIILASSLTEAIDKSECVFFLNTKNSVISGDKVKSDKTYSPWIYHEVYTASTIRQKKPNRRPVCESRDSTLSLLVYQKLPTITYGLNLSNMKKLDINSLNEWVSLYGKETTSHALDVLYNNCDNITIK